MLRAKKIQIHYFIRARGIFELTRPAQYTARSLLKNKPEISTTSGALTI